MTTRWTIVLANGAFTFPVTARWSERQRQELRENNETDYLERVLTVEGKLVGTGSDPAKDVITQWNELKKQCSRLAPHRIELKLDNVTEVDFTPAKAIGTPKCRDLVMTTVPGGDAVTQITFNASFFTKEPKRISGAVELFREVQTFIEDNKVQRKVWIARARAKTISKAKSIVLSFKPPSSFQPLNEETFDRVDINEYEKRWVWLKSDSKKSPQNQVTEVSETIFWKDRGTGWIEDPVVGKDQNPAFHRTRVRSGTVVITLTEEAKDLAAFKIIAPHINEAFGPSGNFRRDVTQETGNQGPQLTSARTGIYRRVTQEFYYWTSKKRPVLIHGGHDQPFEEVAGGNGPIGGAGP